MNKILKKLNLWKEAGLISDSQYESIVRYEEENSPKNRAAYTIITLGAIVICLGIISLIASNWEDINDGVKLVIDFLILSGLSYTIYQQKENPKKWLFEVLIVSYFILILASIGLISQIYNTGGKLYQALLFWCSITFPIALFSQGRATVHLWLTSFLFSITYFLFERFPIFNQDGTAIIWIFGFLPNILLGVYFLFNLIQNKSLTAFGNASLVWAILGFMTGPIFFSLVGNLSREAGGNSLPAIQGLLTISLLLATLSTARSFLINKKIGVFLAIGFFNYFLMSSSHLYEFHSQFLDTVFFILIWFSIGILFHLLDSKKLFEFSIVVIGIRFLVAYFQLFASLMLTGFGLIFSGILIIAISVFYIKNRERLTNWIGEMI